MGPGNRATTVASTGLLYGIEYYRTLRERYYSYYLRAGGNKREKKDKK